MSDVSAILGVLKIGCDAANDAEQIAASGGKNWILDFSLVSTLGSEVLLNVGNFPAAFAEAKSIDANGIGQIAAFLQSNLPSFGSVKFEAIVSAVVAAIIAVEPIFSSSPAAPAAPLA